jgi:hypothetical protein
VTVDALPFVVRAEVVLYLFTYMIVDGGSNRFISLNVEYKSVLDPAWWWVKASNLGGLENPVVQFDLAHVFELLRKCVTCIADRCLCL